MSKASVSSALSYTYAHTHVSTLFFYTAHKWEATLDVSGLPMYILDSCSGFIVLIVHMSASSSIFPITAFLKNH